MTKIKLNEAMPRFEPINMFLFETDKDCYFVFDERYLDFIDFEKNLAVLRAKLLKAPDSIVRLTRYFDRPDLTGYQERAKSWLEESETRLRRRRTQGIYAGFAVAGTAAIAIAASFQTNGMRPFFLLIVGWVILSGYLWRHFTRLMRQLRAAVALGRELIELSEKAINEKDRWLQQESYDERARNTLYLIYQNGIPNMIRSEFYLNGEGNPKRRKFLPPESADGSLTEFFDQNTALTYQKLNSRADEDFAQKMIYATKAIN